MIAAVGLAIWVYQSSLFTVERLDVVGVKRLTPARIGEIAALPAAVTLLRLPAAEIETRLEADPWVSSAEVTRDFPDTVRIRVVERIPLATVSVSAKKRWLVDGTGVWLAPQSASATSAPVLIRDVEGLDPVAGRKTQSETLLNALTVVAQLDKTMASKTKAISAPSIDKTALVTRDDVEVFVGTAENMARKQQIAESILKEEAGNVVYINVRSVDRPTWRGLEQGD